MKLNLHPRRITTRDVRFLELYYLVCLKYYLQEHNPELFINFQKLHTIEQLLRNVTVLSDSLCFTDFLIIKCFLLYRVHDISKDFAFIITIRFDDSYYQGEVPLEAYECLYSSGYTFAIMEAQTGHPAGTGIYNPCALFLVFYYS